MLIDIGDFRHLTRIPWMSWLQITFDASHRDAERIGMMLELCGALAVSTQGPDDEHRLQESNEPQPLWTHNRVTGLFPEFTDSDAIVNQVARVLRGDAPRYRIDILTDRDWSSAWMAHCRPIAINDRMWICPSWIEPPRPDAINVILDPGMAFGTGEHATTALCLSWLADQDLQARHVIDFGSGSGILSIAALKLGAHSVTAVEIDAQARSVSLENARRNGVADRFQVVAPDALPPNLRADTVVANILAGPLITLAPEISAMVRPGGTIAVSGMLTGQGDEVWAHYAKAFRTDHYEHRGEWMIVTGTKLITDGGKQD